MRGPPLAGFSTAHGAKRRERAPRPRREFRLCAADADLLAEIERLRERATTYGLVAAVAVALALITVIVASNAQTASAATARASLTPPRPAPKVVSYPSLAPEQVEKAPYRSPFDSPTI